ncbi:unnamed protein product [Adineta steineri]|uniref:Cullin family profile domain-containing protein n=1 Tax=Adineta steineri TaxID=433720 RepID=A0A814PNN8_9BILA|nr:unnamed protein product [Adineta steineri]
MTSNSAFDESLARIFEAVDRKFRSQIFDEKLYMELYTLIYDHCTSSLPYIELNLLQSANDRQKYLINAGGSSPKDHFIGGQLCYRMENYLINYAKNLYEEINRMSDEDLLPFYVEQWKRYKLSSGALNSAFRYLYRHWMKRAHHNGFTCFNIIKSECNNHLVTNTQLIEDVAQSYMSFDFHEDMTLWVNNEQTTISPLNIHTELFEKPILQKTEQFHQIEATKNKILQESQFEENLRDIMLVFHHTDDKDAFELLYRKLLLKRIINQLTNSDDYEKVIVSKLKEACGHGYTLKLQQIFQDINVSKTLAIEYEDKCDKHHMIHKVDFSVMVLSSNLWPFPESSNFALPIELKSRLDSFTKFYNDRHNGRKLTCLHQYSKGELRTLFTSQKYILQVSTYQMALLLLFNQELNWTVEQIQDKTQMKLELLLKSLLGLLKNKLLLCTNIHEDELGESNIKMDYSIRLATDFESKKLRINLNVPLKSIEQKDIESVDRTIEGDRKIIIQAAIIRIMKARQTSKYALLMQEVIQQLSSRFKPEISVIKKCIDILIEKEYLERQSDQNDILRYLA